MFDVYIHELLKSNNRVIVPDLGAFIARAATGQVQDGSVEHKTIVFNDILKFNDNLLVNHLVKTLSIEKDDALHKIKDYAAAIHNAIINQKEYIVDGIGYLHSDDKGNIVLKQDFSAQKTDESADQQLPSESTENTVVANIAPVITESEPVNAAPEIMVEKEAEIITVTENINANEQNQETGLSDNSVINESEQLPIDNNISESVEGSVETKLSSDSEKSDEPINPEITPDQTELPATDVLVETKETAIEENTETKAPEIIEQPVVSSNELIVEKADETISEVNSDAVVENPVEVIEQNQDNTIAVVAEEKTETANNEIAEEEKKPDTDLVTGENPVADTNTVVENTNNENAVIENPTSENNPEKEETKVVAEEKPIEQIETVEGIATDNKTETINITEPEISQVKIDPVIDEKPEVVAENLPDVNKVEPEKEITAIPPVPLVIVENPPVVKTEEKPAKEEKVVEEKKEEKPAREKLKLDLKKEKKEVKKEVVEEKPAAEVKVEKPVKKKAETTSPNVKKKWPKWMPIAIWSVAGLVILGISFLIILKLGVVKIKGLDFGPDQWVTVNNKFMSDLDKFNKRVRNKIQVPAATQDDNKFNKTNEKKSEGSFDDGGSSGSFDTPADSSQAGTATTNSGSEGSFGSFDSPETKTETKVEKNTNTAKESSSAATDASNFKYHLVAGSFRDRSLADKFVDQLKSQGYPDARFIGQRNGSFVVSYASFNDRTEATNELSKLKGKGVQTWLLSN